jgi:formyltetrahydrofolate deformylase
MSSARHILTLSCANRPGIVARVSAALFDGGFNILDAQQFDDTETGNFFMRVEFNAAKADADIEALRGAFKTMAGDLGMAWTMRPSEQLKRVALMVSRFDHCLVDLLYRWRSGEMPMEPVAIIANYPRDIYAHIDFGGIPFHYLPVTRQTRMEQEALVWETIKSSRADLVVLARYMQILSDGLAAKLQGRCVNIHHSFLPGFKGAKPYHQAHERGVKLIGATAHFVTSDLDEGPIIEQDVERISHRDTPEVLVRKGRDIERRVLARAVANVLDDRVLLNHGKTVIFSG